MSKAKKDQWVWFGQFMLESGEPTPIDTYSKALEDQLFYIGVMRQIFKVRSQP